MIEDKAENAILDIYKFGFRLLNEIDEKNNDLSKWKEKLSKYKILEDCVDDKYSWVTCILALQAVNLGNFGVGSIIVNKDGEIVTHGHNEVFEPYFRSDNHAEMVVMNKFEKEHKEFNNFKGYVLYTSLESCPMCLARLITSGIEEVLHVAADDDGGMVHKISDLPPIWISLAKRQIFRKAKCSKYLMESAKGIFLINTEKLDRKLSKR